MIRPWNDSPICATHVSSLQALAALHVCLPFRGIKDVSGCVGAQEGDGRTGGISSYIVVTHQHSTIRRAVDRCKPSPHD